MPRITIHVGGREQLQATISKATPMGLLGTEAIVRLGQTSITGSATALRALAAALVEAEEVGPSLKWATAKPQRTNSKAKAGNGPTKGGAFDEPAPF